MAATTGLPEVGEIVELVSMGRPDYTTMRFEVLAVDPRTGLMEAKACEADADGQFTHIRMKLSRLQ